MLVFKIRRDGRPCYFKEKFSNETNPGYKTRFQVQEKIKKSRIYKYEEAKKSFVPNSIDLWNRLPHDLRSISKLEAFKVKLKDWIRSNVKI